jgi:hypothetical protein
MRILFPTLTRFPSWEAPAVQVANMAQALAELGHDVTVVATAPDTGLARSHPDAARDPALLLGFSPRFTTLVLSPRVHRGQSYLHALRIARLVRRERPDLVFSRNLRACLLPSLRGVPTVFEAHTLDALLGRQERWVLARLLASPGFRGIVAISAALAEDLTTELGVPAERLLVAHDAVRLVDDAAPAVPPGPAAPTARVAASAGSARLRAGYTGSLFPGKGVETIVAAARRCPGSSSTSSVDRRRWRTRSRRAPPTTSSSMAWSRLPRRAGCSAGSTCCSPRSRSASRATAASTSRAGRPR